MKFDKLIELLKEMETTIESEENQTFLEKLNREELINTMQFLQRCAAQAGYYYNLQAPGSEFGIMKLQATENDDPIVAQAKIWDNKEHKIHTRFSLRRFLRFHLSVYSYRRSLQRSLISSRPAWKIPSE